MANTSLDELIREIETREWLESLDFVIQNEGPERVRELLAALRARAQQAGIDTPVPLTTPYLNTIPVDQQPAYPGDLEVERRIENIVRWNAAAMVVRANRREDGIGGHLSTYASAATLYEVGFNHFFRGPDHPSGGDKVFFQGHASPGIYARAFLEGRITETQLENFRRELAEGGGLSSYPHPWLMPGFWQFPTVSMGLGPLMAIYQARFDRYLERRGFKPRTDAKVWAFLGDGEMDEPEATGALRLAAREQLDNLIFVVNCNLQRLDGPVRGNSKVVQELEALFRGAGWHVIKVLWSSDWDPLFERDREGRLVRRLDAVLDGELQKYAVESGAYMRERLFNTPELQELVAHLSDVQLKQMRRGGHDPVKVYAAYKAAVEHTGSPVAILTQTVKGFLLGEKDEARNVAHDRKKMDDDELLAFRDRLGLPLTDDQVRAVAFYRPADDSREVTYARERRRELGGSLPQRRESIELLPPPDDAAFEEFKEGSDRKVSTTMAAVRLLTNLLRDKNIGARIVPIVPDEARTFGMESLFRQIGIYSPVGQLYDPVDSNTLLPYKETENGQMLEEGITEDGAMASFIAAGTSGYTNGVTVVPFFWFYSMFGLQRFGDLAWAAAELRTKGFLVGGLAGRTQLAGEGLQHQDGHSHLLAYPIPNLKAYDPAFAFEIAAIVKDGLRRMFVEGEDVFYYFTVGNENYVQQPMPKGKNVEEGIVRGMYLFRKSGLKKPAHRAQLLGSGSIMNEVLKAQEMLEKYGVAADVWSVTSYKELYRDAIETERWNLLHPEAKPKVPYVRQLLEDTEGPIVAASDYVKALPDSIGRWLPRPLVALGTDGFGRSESRAALRAFFEVDARWITHAVLSSLAREGRLDAGAVRKAMDELGIDPEKADPIKS
ncbi:MAG: pyruvate dehydrogenase (acetyl-transferring), homodimeric type [Clostridia bacterium]|nr:pyruvate dehydrogenase (acetyl-transferring), homodimeric type [Clostridia bacterium]